MASKLYFISEYAKQNLIKQAIAKRYVSPKAILRYQGLSNYIEWIANNGVIQDARPADVRASDTARLEAGLFPYWSTEETRVPVRLVLSLATQDALVALANRFAIVNHRRGLSSLRRDMKGARVSAVLEAIGISWLSVSEK